MQLVTQVHVATGDCGLDPSRRAVLDATKEAVERAFARITFEANVSRERLEIVSVAPFFVPAAGDGPGTIYATVVARYQVGEDAFGSG